MYFYNMGLNRINSSDRIYLKNLEELVIVIALFDVLHDIFKLKQRVLIYHRELTIRNSIISLQKPNQINKGNHKGSMKNYISIAKSTTKDDSS